jgi:PhnB protein
MGHAVTMGNNVHLNLEPDTRAEAERLFAALAEGGTIEMPLQQMFWGALWGSLTDRFGMKWMVNCAAPA